MRDLNTLNHWRRTDAHVMRNWGWVGDGTAGMFMIPSPIDRKIIAVVASAGDGWDHVSVSRATRCPNWPEMSYIARLFFNDDETAMQLHVPAAEHVNNHPYCLHWWRPTDMAIPKPPAIFVGLKEFGTVTPDTIAAASAKAADVARERYGL